MASTDPLVSFELATRRIVVRHNIVRRVGNPYNSGAYPEAGRSIELKFRADLRLAQIVHRRAGATPRSGLTLQNNKEQFLMAPRLAPAAISIIVLASIAGQASATVTDYTDPTDYSAATSNSTTFTFDGLTPPGTVSIGNVSVGDLSFTVGSLNFPLVVGSGIAPFYGGSPFFTSVSASLGIDTAELMCTLAGSTAIGFTYGDFLDVGGLPFLVTLSTGDSFTLSTPPNPGFDTGFVGFVSDTPITSVTFSSSGSAFDLLQVETSSAPAVAASEPPPCALILTGLLSLALLARRRSVAVRTAVRCAKNDS
jgi:hypothetical protein